MKLFKFEIQKYVYMVKFYVQTCKPYFLTLNQNDVMTYISTHMYEIIQHLLTTTMIKQLSDSGLP